MRGGVGLFPAAERVQLAVEAGGVAQIELDQAAQVFDAVQVDALATEADLSGPPVATSGSIRITTALSAICMSNLTDSPTDAFQPCGTVSNAPLSEMSSRRASHCSWPRQICTLASN